MGSATNEAGFEDTIVTELCERGWVAGGSKSYSVPLGLIPGELIAFLRASQPDEWAELTRRLGGEAVAEQQVPTYVARQLDARGTIAVLRGGIKMNGVALRLAYFGPANGLTPELWERYAANLLTVIRQLHHSESRPKDSVDLALFVNGIPTATAELKNPLTGQTARDARRQYRRDRNPADLIFRARAAVHFAVDPHEVWMTTRLAGADTRFLPFNQGSGGPGEKGGAGNPPNPAGHATAYLWRDVWERAAWLDLIGTFIHVEEERDDSGRRTGSKRTLFPRFHQWHAVRSLLAATRLAGPGRDRLIEHSAGSGKSNTIAWLAAQLSRLHSPHDPADLTEELRSAGLGTDQPIFSKVVIITDRRVLDRQLQETVSGFEHTPGTIVAIDKDSKQLRDALAGNTARIIVTTLQKFPVVAKLAREAGADAMGVAGRRFAVIVDEAHSSTTGEAVKELKSVLRIDDATAGLVTNPADATGGEAETEPPDVADLLLASAEARGRARNLSFFAFTATPKDRTLEMFGEPKLGADGQVVKAAFHLYSMRQAIEEGFILDVLEHYTTYATYYRLAHADPAVGATVVPKGKASARMARFAVLHPTNVAQRAEIIVEHFREQVQRRIGGRAKAMVVTSSRLHAVRYKIAIDNYIERRGYDRGTDPIAALVAFSGDVVDPDAPVGTAAYTEPGMNRGIRETELPQRFAGDDFQVLIVAEKYQTGFDQPLLHTMYVDKRLVGVAAVQTLSRLNRIHPPEKTEVFVLDFVNEADDIIEAFKPFFEATYAAPTDPNILYTLAAAIETAGVVDARERDACAAAVLAGQSTDHADVLGNLAPTLERYRELEDDDARSTFSDRLHAFVRAYRFLAQIMPWTDTDLEALYIYSVHLLALIRQSEADEDGPAMPDVTDGLLLTHLRTELVGDDQRLSLVAGTDEPGSAMPGEGAGRNEEEPTGPLAELVAALNDRFGLGLSDADGLYFAQIRQEIMDSAEMRLYALNNDRDGYRVVLEQKMEAIMLDRYAANRELFTVYTANPQLREVALGYFLRTYDGFHREAG